MKRTLFLFAIAFLTTLAARAQDTVNLSSIRIGPYKIGMSRAEAEQLAGTRLRIGTEANNFNDTNMVLYGGQRVYLSPMEVYNSETDKPVIIGRMWTRSNRFRTKSGIGVGSTRQDLLAAYGSFPRFEVYPEYDENGKPSPHKGFFTLYDMDAETAIQFYLINNVVWEVRVIKDFGEGC